MIDGLDPSYATPGVMPELYRLGAAGMSTLVDAVAPTVTNANNAGISCAAWPSEHGITGNYYFDPATGDEDYMERPELLLRPTLMTQVTDAGGQAALLTAKKKTASLLGTKTTLAVAAEDPPPEFTRRYGQPPGIYSAGINHWLWTVAVDLLRTRTDIDLLYVHTTDFPMHAWAPGAPESDEHLTRLDALIGEAVHTAPDAAFFATADHGMNSKGLVWDLNQALASRQAPVRRAHVSATSPSSVTRTPSSGTWTRAPSPNGCPPSTAHTAVSTRSRSRCTRTTTSPSPTSPRRDTTKTC